MDSSDITIFLAMCGLWLLAMIVVTAILSVISVWLGFSTKASALKYFILFILFNVAVEALGVVIFAKYFHLL